MVWLLFVAVLSATQMVHGILNTTSVIIHPEGWSIYPCLQVNHREQEMDSAMMGLWYVIEIIHHQNEPQYEGHMAVDLCPKINLYKTSPSDIKLIWHEKAGDVHYSFRMTDPENSGFWISWSRQNGSMLNKGYRQFVGSVQVIEAQPNRMVLTFCSNETNRTHYSIIMVRNITIHHDTQNVHRTLEQYNLKEVGVRLTCRDQTGNSASQQSVTAAAVVLPTLLLLVSRLN